MFPVRRIFSSSVRCKTENPGTSLRWIRCRQRHTPPGCLSGAGGPGRARGARGGQATKEWKNPRSSFRPLLDLFDQQYAEELGGLWSSTRSVLLDPDSWQYGVMLNRFAAVTDVTQVLQSQGFSRLLPQTHVSRFPSDAATPASRPKHRTGRDSLSPDCSSHRPPDDPPQPDSSLHSVQPELPRPSPRPSLQCYIHPDPLRFPSQAHRRGQLKQYYLLNAASLLPVLALQVRDGDKVLDLCSAPGGKAIAIMQYATPALLCCNEPDPHRRDRLAKTLESFLPHSLSSTVMVSEQDGRVFGRSEAATYDKVLVDAPCSNDRSWLYSSSSHQGEQRLRERSQLPLLQAQLLQSALAAVRPGGLVVYSTCTLSGAENDAVVERVLNDCPEAEAEDLWEEMAAPLSGSFRFTCPRPGGGRSGVVSSYRHRRGLLVVPQPGKTWGPMFVSRIRRKKE